MFSAIHDFRVSIFNILENQRFTCFPSEIHAFVCRGIQRINVYVQRINDEPESILSLKLALRLDRGMDRMKD